MVRFEVGEADSEGSLRPGHRTGLGSQARRNKGPEKSDANQRSGLATVEKGQGPCEQQMKGFIYTEGSSKVEGEILRGTPV